MRRRTSRGLLDWLRPYLERDPVLWKDLTLEHAARWGGRLGMAAGWLVVVCVLIGAGHVFVTVPVGESYFLRDGFYLYTSTVNVALACVAVLAVAIRASCAVTSEAEKDTLVVLMSTPLKAETIVWSKLLASLYGARALVALMLFNAGLSVIRTPVAMIAHAGALLQLLVMSLAVGAMAIWISATAKSSVTAIIKTVLLCTVIGGGYLFCGMCCLLGGPSSDAYSMILAPCVPFLLGMPYFWFNLGQYGGQWFFAPYVCGTVAYLVIGLGAYHAAADELDRRCRGNANIFNS